MGQDAGVVADSPGRALLARYAVTWAYLLGFIIAEVVFALLPARDQAATLGWASTNLANLRHDPVGSMIGSAFIGTGAAWPVIIGLALLAANHVLGNWRTVLVCGAAHVIGTLVSEGIVAYRIAAGLLPASDAYIQDVGPSYIVAAALTVAALYGSRLPRGVGVVGLAVLVFPGHIFAGLTTLQVAAVGHAVAIVCAALLGGVLAGWAVPWLPRVRSWRTGNWRARS